jgi:flavin-dependent dehydrogenase
MATWLGQQALVIGGGLAGMAAARVLADHFAEVIILDEDRFPQQPGLGAISNATHVFAISLRAQQMLEELFPALKQNLLRAGAIPLDPAADIEWLTPAGWGVRFPSRVSILSCTRDLLEWEVRKQLASFPRVKCHAHTQAGELVCDSSGTRVVGVGVRHRNRAGSVAESTICADLVVDASGRNSQAPEWLAAVGYQKPEEISVNGFPGYASRLFQALQVKSQDSKAVCLQPAPPAFVRGGWIFPIEQDRMMVTLVGVGRDYPPSDESGFREFAASMRSPVIHEFISRARPISDIVSHRSNGNRWRRYELLKRWPEGFLLLGDALCSFHPVLGHGTTIAGLHALVLRNWLNQQRQGASESPSRNVSEFLHAAADVSEAPWLVATQEDCRVIGFEGQSPPARTRRMHRHMDRVIALATRDVEARRALLRVMYLEAEPSALLTPRLLWQAARQKLGKKRVDHANSCPESDFSVNYMEQE